MNNAAALAPKQALTNAQAIFLGWPDSRSI